MLFLALFAAIATGIYFAIKGNTLVIPSVSHALPDSVNTAHITLTPVPVAAANASATKEKEQVPASVQAVIEVNKKWSISRGYLQYIDNDEYKTYSKEILQKLVDAGDMRAMQTLAGLIERDDRTRAIELYNLAAVYGSTKALGNVSGWAASISMALDNAEEKKSNVIISMAYVKVAAMRGDNFLYYADARNPILTNPGEIALTAEDYDTVKTLAQKIYDGMQKKRDALGLGPFDNYAPASINQIDDVEKQSMNFRY